MHVIFKCVRVTLAVDVILVYKLVVYRVVTVVAILVTMTHEHAGR
jgi:hypothetical protein